LVPSFELSNPVGLREHKPPHRMGVVQRLMGVAVGGEAIRGPRRYDGAIYERDEIAVDAHVMGLPSLRAMILIWPQLHRSQSATVLNGAFEVGTHPSGRQ
jgi:hypothetical protein